MFSAFVALAAKCEMYVCFWAIWVCSFLSGGNPCASLCSNCCLAPCNIFPRSHLLCQQSSSLFSSCLFILCLLVWLWFPHIILPIYSTKEGGFISHYSFDFPSLQCFPPIFAISSLILPFQFVCAPIFHHTPRFHHTLCISEASFYFQVYLLQVSHIWLANIHSISNSCACLDLFENSQLVFYDAKHSNSLLPDYLVRCFFFRKQVLISLLFTIKYILNLLIC